MSGWMYIAWYKAGLNNAEFYFCQWRRGKCPVLEKQVILECGYNNMWVVL